MTVAIILIVVAFFVGWLLWEVRGLGKVIKEIQERGK